MAEIIEIPVDNPVTFTQKEWTGVGLFFVFFILILISLLIGNTPENREKRRKYFEKQELRKKGDMRKLKIILTSILEIDHNMQEG